MTGWVAPALHHVVVGRWGQLLDTIEVIEASLPVWIAAQKVMNEPRYASLPNIMKAKKKEVKALKASP